MLAREGERSGRFRRHRPGGNECDAAGGHQSKNDSKPQESRGAPLRLRASNHHVVPCAASKLLLKVRKRNIYPNGFLDAKVPF